MTTEDEGRATDEFLEELLIAPDAGLESALRSSEAAGLPSIQVSPLQGKSLHLLASAVGARRILEVGTLGGYSTIWLARALPAGGRMVSLELNPRHAEVARANLLAAGVADRVEVRLGPALELMERLLAEGGDPFDLAFIDADKPNVVAYVEHALRLVRPHGLIIVDNVVRRGQVRDPADPDPNVRATRELLLRLSRDRVHPSSVLQTVGRKGHDGWALILAGEGAAGSRPSPGDPGA